MHRFTLSAALLAALALGAQTAAARSLAHGATEALDEFARRVADVGPDVLVVTGDHSTPSSMAMHSWHPVPVLLRAKTARVDDATAFGESQCRRGSLGTVGAIDLMPLMLAHAGRLAKFGA